MQKHVKERRFVNLPKHSKMDLGYNKKSASAEGISAETDFFVSGVLNFSFFIFLQIRMFLYRRLLLYKNQPQHL